MRSRLESAKRAFVLLFVYGTLKRGESNHAQLEGARFVKRASTAPEYELVDLGGFPALLEDGSTAVSGELYDVDDDHLAALDAFEDVPTLYERRPIRVAGMSVETYVMRREHAEDAPRIGGGDWRKHRRETDARS